MIILKHIPRETTDEPPERHRGLHSASGIADSRGHPPGHGQRHEDVDREWNRRSRPQGRGQGPRLLPAQRPRRDRRHCRQAQGRTRCRQFLPRRLVPLLQSRTPRAAAETARGRRPRGVAGRGVTGNARPFTEHYGEERAAVRGFERRRQCGRPRLQSGFRGRRGAAPHLRQVRHRHPRPQRRRYL